MQQDIFPRIQAIFADYFIIDESDVSFSKTMEDLGLDSLDMVEIIFAIEEEFEIEMDFEEYEEMKTVGDLVASITSKFSAAQ